MTDLQPLYASAWFVLWLFSWLLIARIIVEFVRSLARDWRPRGGLAVGLETVFTITDPPVKLLRRLIPSVPIGNIRLDLSILVLFVMVFIAMWGLTMLQPVAI